MWLQRSHPDCEDPSLNYGCHDMQRDSAATLNALAETQRYFFPLFWFWAHWIEAILTIGPIFTQIARAMFAYQQKSVRRLVNCHQSRNGPGPPRLYFIFFFLVTLVEAVSAGEAEFMTSASSDLSLCQRGVHALQEYPQLSCTYVFQGRKIQPWKGPNWNPNMTVWLMKMVSCEGLDFELRKVKREGYVGTQ